MRALPWVTILIYYSYTVQVFCIPDDVDDEDEDVEGGLEDGENEKETSEDAEFEKDSEEELISVSYFSLGYIMTGERLREPQH